MSIQKAEAIQKFVNEKLNRRKEIDPETTLLVERRHNKRENGNRLHPNDACAGGGNSSALSESDESSRGQNHAYDDEETALVTTSKKKNPSDADLDTDDDAGPRHRTGNDRNRKSRSVSKSYHGYGGTEAVELETADGLASYSQHGKQAGATGLDLHTDGKQRRSGGKGGDNHTPSGSRNRNPHHHGKNSSHVHKHAHEANHHHGATKKSHHQDHHVEEDPGDSEHCHDSSDERSELEEKKRKKAMRKLLIASILSCVFMVGEIVGGYLANSLAIMTDASHLLTDVSSFLISILALKMASRPISAKMTFGWHRAEIIGALISVLAIWVVTGVLVYLAVMRVVKGNFEVNGKTMLITASIAVGFNVLMGLVLHEHSHTHGAGGHSHDHDEEEGGHSHNDDSGNVNVRAAFIHVIGDLLQSLGVLTAAFIIYFKPEYKIADPICTFLFSVLVLFTTITILRDTIIVIMEGTPVGVKYEIVKEKLLEIDGVMAVHDLRIWSLTLNQTVMSAHLAVEQSCDPNAILKRATRRLKALYEFHSLTLQVEYYSNDMDDCKKCRPADGSS